MNPDFAALLNAFAKAQVRFLVVGAYALAFYGHPRATGDLDLWIEPELENAHRVMQALIKFGAPLKNLSAADFASPGSVFQIGIAPIRIDLLTELTGIHFAEAWNRRNMHKLDGMEVPLISREDLIKNKKLLGRMKDLADLEALD